MNIETLIASRLAATKKFAVVATYADGATRQHETETKKQAENFAIEARRKIGKNLIGRETGKAVRVIRVDIITL